MVGEGLCCTVCAQSMVIQLKMCRDKGQIPHFKLGHRLHCALIFAGQYNSFNQSERLHAAAENNPEIHDYREPCASVRRGLV